MQMAKLDKYIVEEIVFRNNIRDAKMQLKNTFRYQVKYLKNDEKHCMGELTLEIGDADADTPLYIQVRMRGFFQLMGQDKRRIHVDSFYQLFPYGRAIVTSLCASACLPPIMFPVPDVQEENIDVNFQD